MTYWEWGILLEKEDVTWREQGMVGADRPHLEISEGAHNSRQETNRVQCAPGTAGAGDQPR